MKKKVLLVDYQTTMHYMVTDETKNLQLQKKALNYMQNINCNRDAARKARKNYTNSLLQLGAWLKNHDIAVFYVNIPDDHALFTEKIEWADIILFWTTTPAYSYIAELIIDIKKRYSDKVLITSGYHVSGIPRDVLKELPDLDYIVIGEMETAILKLCDGTVANSIPGMAGRYKGEIFINDEPVLLNGDEIPSPDYTLLHGDLKKYRYYLQMTRGCPFRCRYCVYGYFWKKVRFRSMESMERELLFLKGIMGNSFEMHFFDNIVTLDKKRITDLSSLIKKLGMNLSFSADVRAEYVQDVATVKLLEDFGVKQLFYGFEDVNPECRKMANRTLNEELLINSLRLVKENSNISCDGYWMLGLPGTTVESIKNNITFVCKLIEDRLIESICPDTIFVPLPGTPLYNEAETFGITNLDPDWKKYQRSNYNPVFSLQTISKKEMYDGLILFDKIIIQKEAEVLGVNVDEAVRRYMSADGGSCVESFLK